jgi:REP element-mobilizing transposase RayT
MKQIREKRHRLDSDIYKGELLVTFTLCIKNKIKFFIDEKRFLVFEQLLLNELKSFKCSAFVYLFMPDHVHLTLTGNESNSDIKKCLDMFKQKTGFWFSQNQPDVKWQKDYYDHILRSKENLDIHIKYILNNPVRVGLVEYWKQYPFKGSTVYNLNEWASNW